MGWLNYEQPTTAVFAPGTIIKKPHHLDSPRWDVGVNYR